MHGGLEGPGLKEAAIHYDYLPLIIHQKNCCSLVADFVSNEKLAPVSGIIWIFIINAQYYVIYLKLGAGIIANNWGLFLSSHDLSVLYS